MENLFTNDFFNGIFQIFGTLFICRDIQLLLKHKTIKGKGVGSNLFFAVWGFWNLYYYPSLDQWFSFFGGLCIVIANMVWFSIAIHYMRKEKSPQIIVGENVPG